MFFSISNSTDNTVGFVFPQVGCLNQELAHSIKFSEFNNFDREMLFQLEPNAKLTDVLSQASISADGLLINSKVRDILNEFTLMTHRYYKCVVRDNRDNLHDYYWIHLIDNSLLNKIDYPNSKFYAREYGFREHDVELTSYEDYEIQRRQLGDMWGIGSDCLKLKDNSDFPDLFRVPLLGNEIVVRPKLAESMRINGVTGLVIEETNEIEG